MNDPGRYLGYPKYRLKERNGTTRLVKNVMDYSSIEKRDCDTITADEMDEWSAEFRRVELRISDWKWLGHCGVAREAHEGSRLAASQRTEGK